MSSFSLPQSGRLHPKVALITGGGMGLGEGIVRKFVIEGARVVIFEIDAAAGERVATSLPKDSVALYVGDVTNEAHWLAAVKMAVETFGGLDVVVNNAGVVHTSAPSHKVPQSEYDRIMTTNITPLYHSLAAARPIFTAQHSGVFINISSISAPRPRPNLVWYAGSKGAVSAITKGLAAELAPFNVRCNAICPVLADTGMVVPVLGGMDSAEGRAVVTKGIPLGRICRPEDVGNAAAWLASEEAGFITGIELPVDGGRALM
ncbi:uncharacterized protein MYCGRDRAFT_97474 [Zymoseptoria tritici IPO323]|uniref:Oxidoreductase n=1 Tax=Zymoseptoria tritici (strain CBS 115943 / IPO323) TaxID=336722 RepID=F9XQB7_ZYMTI|nr:uncharacterized protein MYCGRDRAFT_97474 [Zymoseptoria tritici IPO323]EGP82684.1 hypothetical protein MYCGRDRAFT_97474 [Zymoseptoria tritici IPO323]